MRTRALKSLTAMIAAAGIACTPTDSQVISLGGNPDTLQVRGQNDSIVLTNPDTTFGPPDTVIISRTDTLVTVPDSILIEVVDTVEVAVVDTVVVGSDTTFVTSVDTVFALRVDTLVSIDTIVVTTVDTLVSVDTVVVADTVRVETRLVAASQSQSLNDGLVIDSGQTARLTVSANNALDEPTIPGMVTWLSDAPGTASVTDGLVRGRRPGTANIFAIAEGLSVRVRTSVRRVESTSPPPPLPEGSQSRFFRAHEPSGMTKISERPFSELREGWGIDFDGNPESIASDTGAPHSPPSVIQFNYASGFRGGGPGGNTGTLFFSRSYETIYVYLTWKIDPDWQGHNSTVNKQFFLTTTNPTRGSGHNTLFNARTAGSGSMIFRLSGQEYCCDDPFAVFDGNVGSHSLRRGDWHEIELVVTANNPGIANGRVEVWIDGEKSHDHRDFNALKLGEGPGFNKLLWSSIWGGIGDVVQDAQWIRVDHMYVSGKN